MTDGLAWALGCVVALVGLAFLAWALFADRSRGRSRCSRCWYELPADRAGEPARCPECGRVVRRPFKTRRRWRWGACGVAISCAGVAWPVSRQISKEGWLSVVPTPILLEMYLGDWGRSSQPVEDEVSFHRISQGKYWRVYRDWVVSRCLRELNDASSVDRDNAASLLAWIGDRDARVTPALLRLLQDADPVVRQRAVRSLGIYRADPASAISPLLAVVADPLEAAPTRAEAASVIGRYGEDAATAVPALVNALSDPDPTVRGGAAEALGWIGVDADRLVPLLLSLLRTAPSDDQRFGALIGLGLFGERAAPASATVAIFMDSADQGLANEALRTLMRIGRASPEVVAKLRAVSRPQSQGGAQFPDRTAAVALRAMEGGAPSPVAALVEELASDDVGARMHAVWELRRLRWRAQEALPALITVLDDPEPRVSFTAAQALAELREDVPAVVGALRSRPGEGSDFALGILSRRLGVWPSALPR